MRSTLGGCELSVLIATRDRAASLARTLDSLAVQELSGIDWELFVVDNGSSDETCDVLTRFAHRLPLVVLTEPRAGKNRALNRALEHASGRLLVFTDDDVVVSPRWLVSLVEATERWPAAAVFGGPIEPLFPPETPAWLSDPDFVLASEAFGAKRESVEGHTSALPFGPNLAIRASVFEGLRFDEAIGPVAGTGYAQGSEHELLLRLRNRGERVIHVPEAKVAHVIRREQLELQWLLGRAERIGRGAARVGRKRVPRTAFGWIPLFWCLWYARCRAWRACHLDEAKRFGVVHRVHYWRGYIDESRILWRE